jgi:hypothetical protein
MKPTLLQSSRWMCLETASTILTANGTERTTERKHYYAMGEDRRWVDLYLCSEVPAEGTVSLL